MPNLLGSNAQLEGWIDCKDKFLGMPPGDHQLECEADLLDQHRISAFMVTVGVLLMTPQLTGLPLPMWTPLVVGQSQIQVVEHRVVEHRDRAVLLKAISEQYVRLDIPENSNPRAMAMQVGLLVSTLAPQEMKFRVNQEASFGPFWGGNVKYSVMPIEFFPNSVNVEVRSVR